MDAVDLECALQLFEALLDGKEKSGAQVAQEAHVDRQEAGRAWAILAKMEAVEKSEIAGVARYRAKLPFGAYQLIKGVELGFDIEELCQRAKVCREVRKAAMDLSAEVKKLKDLRQKEAKENEVREKAKRRDALKKDLVAETLLDLIEASGASVGKTGDKEVAKALADAKKQALRALAAYEESWIKGPGGEGY